MASEFVVAPQHAQHILNHVFTTAKPGQYTIRASPTAAVPRSDQQAAHPVQPLPPLYQPTSWQPSLTPSPLSPPSCSVSTAKADSSSKDSKGDTLTVTDNRSGKSIVIPIKHNTVEAVAFQKLSSLQLYDPGFMNTCSATSRICEIKGGQGILRYRGYPIEQLAEQSTFLEVAFLLIYGELPNATQLDYFDKRVMRHTFVHEDLKKAISSFRYDAHPMGMLISTIAALSTFHPEANPALVGQDVYKDMQLRNKQIHRIIGCMPTMAAFVYRHRIGRPFVNPSGRDMSYVSHHHNMLSNRFATGIVPCSAARLLTIHACLLCVSSLSVRISCTCSTSCPTTTTGPIRSSLVHSTSSSFSTPITN